MLTDRFWRSLHSFWHFLSHLIQQRFTSLILILIGVFLPFQIFGELAEEVWENEGFSWDMPILLAVRQFANPGLDQFAIGLTQLGVFWGVFPVAFSLSVWLLLKRHWHWLAYFLTTLLGSIVINRTAKVLLRRVRPDLWISPAPEFDYGFPSGHAMSSMTLVAVLVIMAPPPWRWWVLGMGSLFVLAIGWTRLYLGVHYPSDIVAGWLVSIAWAIAVKLVLRPRPLNR